ARRYKADVPEGKIPAHWLPNRWGQNWPGLVEGVDLDAPFKGKSKEYITEQAERFYVSLGFPTLPPSFSPKPHLYPPAPQPPPPPTRSRATRRPATPAPGTSTSTATSAA